MPTTGPNLSGQTFGRFTIVQLHTERNKHGQRLWVCQCSCGNVRYNTTATLRAGTVVSCGCFMREQAKTKVAALRSKPSRGNLRHGMSGTPEWGSWVEMRRRCYVPTSRYYADYGGRGVAVCERWKDSFENFYADMGRKPTKEHSIDRIDNDGPYSPENCRWATKKEQARNRRSNHRVTAHGQTKTIAEWAELLGMDHRLLRQRLLRLPVEQAIPVP